MSSQPDLNSLLEVAIANHDVKFKENLKGGGQKRVVLVEDSGDLSVLKLVIIGSSSPDALKRAIREVQLLSEIDCDHVVRVKSALNEIGSPIGAASWLEEYLDGEDLTDSLGQPWDWPTTATMAKHVAKGLNEMHQRGIVHRDLSPNNIRCTSNGIYVVMDPGFARHTLKSGLTVGGQPGTPGFLSPEHFQSFSGAPTPAADIFGIGILMYTSLTGQLPFAHDTDPADYYTRVTQGLRPSLSDLRPDLDSQAVALVDKALHPQPARRFLDASHFLHHIGAIQ